MADPVTELVSLLRAVGMAEFVVIGGLAVRFLTDERTARHTRDIDLVAMNNDARDRLVAHLESIGYRVGATAGWHRAAMPQPAPRPIVDIATNPIVNPRTFEELTLRGQPVPHKLEDMTVQVVSPNDLALLKLAAHRDQDVVDLLLLSERLSPKAIAGAAELDDVERTVSEGAQTARLLTARGGLTDLTEELLGRQATPREIESFERFLRDLEEEGL